MITGKKILVNSENAVCSFISGLVIVSKCSIAQNNSELKTLKARVPEDQRQRRSAPDLKLTTNVMGPHPDIHIYTHSVGKWTAHLQRVLSADGNDLILVVAQLTGPRASLTDPLDEAGLVGATY